jgi:hypothetical protein
VIAYEGSNQLPYAQTWTSGSGWDDGVALGTALLAVSTPMAIVALDSGPSDLLAVYVAAGGGCSNGSGCLYGVSRSASTKAWSPAVMVHPNAFTPAAPALAAMSGGRAVLAWKGGNGEGYGSVYAAAPAPVWSSPAQLTAAQVASAPSVAPGVCGDDAVAAYSSGGIVYTTHFAGGTWTAPAPLSGEAGVTTVSIATAP